MDRFDDLAPLSKVESVAMHTWRMHTIKGFFGLYLNPVTRKSMPTVDAKGVEPADIFKVLGDYFSRKIQNR